MNCFEHSSRPAVGICKYCGRGVCRDCAALVHDALACRGACEEQVRREHQLITQSERRFADSNTVFETTSGTYWRAFATSSIMGAVMLLMGLGLLAMEGPPLLMGILIGLGIILIINAAGHAKASRSYRKLASDATSSTPVSEESI